MTEIIDMHTHCSPAGREDPFGVRAAMAGTRVGRNIVSSYRGLPAVMYHELTDFELQQQVSAAAGVTRRLISTPFTIETVTEFSDRPALDIVKFYNDEIAATVAQAPTSNWGMGSVNPLDPGQIAEAERCMTSLGMKGLLVCSSWHGRFLDGEDAYPFWEWAEDRQVPIFVHPPRVPIGHDRQMDQYKLDELVGRPFDTAMSVARMILSGLLDRYPRLKLVIAHMGGGLLPVMGRLNFGWRLGCDGMPERAAIKCERLPSEYLELLNVDTMGIWAPHLKEAVEVFGPGRVMFGTDYGPVPIDPSEHVEMVRALDLPAADKEQILWRNADAFFGLGLAGRGA
jgi:aminocarboxymuconate-semialdehyde decarboxylase